MNELMTTTYSMWSLFRNCRRACEKRYVQKIAPIKQEKSLAFGSLVHKCLELWHKERNLEKVLKQIDLAYPGHAQDEDQRGDWHLATAMLKGYAARYAAEEFEIVALEKTFEGEIINPSTGAASRSFILAGKVDGIVRIGGEYYLLEHKTTSLIDSSYLERLWTDFQVILYSWYINETLGIPVTGIIYNILAKAKLQQSKGETEVEFEARKAELLAKSKTGKTSAKRKLPETDEEFQGRLAVKYAEQEMFHRETLYISRDRYDVLRAELWELTQAFLEARRRGYFYQNTAFCFRFRTPCAYYPICSSDDNPNITQNLYQVVDPFAELKGSETENELPF